VSQNQNPSTMPLGIVTQLFINGEFVNSVSGKTFPSINPADESVIAEFQEAGEADVNLAVAAARTAFDEGPWSKFNGSQRRNLILKLAQLIEDNADEIALLESRDNGKPVAIARNVDVALAIECLRYYAGWAEKLQGKHIPVAGNNVVFTRHEAVGVVGQIIPWNFPLLMLAWKFGPALATGCTIVLKSSEKTPVSALLVAKLVQQAGFPAGVINVLSGFGPTCGEFLVKHNDVDKIAFTGSSLVGHRIQSLAGQGRLKRLTLELGGKSPLIVFPDADLDQAVATANSGIFFNNGQVCTASSRVFVHEDIYEEFLAKSKVYSQNHNPVHPEDPASIQGALVDKIQFDKVLGYIESGKAEGARVITGGNRHGDKGYFIEPTVFADVKDDMKICREEIFGPVVSVIKFKDEAEAVKRANATVYGLAAGVCTKNISTALRVSAALRAGTVWVNCWNSFDAAAPFGGFKTSGLGRELGEYGIAAYTEVKAVVIAL